MFKKYDRNTFSKLDKQHNILVLVGNGFDISVLKKHKEGKLKGKTTSYADFYDYITYYNLSNYNLSKESNILYETMREKKNKNIENWSDFENIIQELCSNNESESDDKVENETSDIDNSETSSKKVEIKTIEESIDEFQGYFTRFLNDIVDPDTMLAFNKHVRENKLAMQSMRNFSKDLTKDESINFLKNGDHYDLFYYVFLNFNYTSLLDNYLYLDKNQFDPHCHKTVDTNFWFETNRKNKIGENIRHSSYILCDVLHPHGVQDIPRSILFGIDRKKYDKATSEEKRLVKSYWSQYDTKYKSYIDEAELFIIYGMSLGETDAWWMDQIYDAILNRNAELIIYMYGDIEDTEVKARFLNVCIRHSDSSEEEKEKVKKNIYVVTFKENNTYFLGLEKIG